MKVSFEGAIHSIRISGNYCESHNIGDMVPIKILEGSDIVLFPNYSAFIEFVSIFILSAYGLSPKSLRKKRATSGASKIQF